MDSGNHSLSLHAPGPKGLAKARGPALVQIGPYEVLSRELEEWMFARPDVLSEGSVRDVGDGAQSWFGSTMMTFDLAALAAQWRGPFDEDARARVLDAIRNSPRVRLRAMRVAREEVMCRLPGTSLGTAEMETSVRIAGDKIQVDVDVEVPLVLSSATR